MAVKLLFFGAVADKLGKRSVDVQAGLSLAELIKHVECADIQPLLVAVNQEQTHDMDYVLQDGDEVALMPPFSGG
jgi:molybdopterin converting factor small subunit